MSSYKGPTLMTPSEPNYLPYALSVNTIMCELWLQCMNSGLRGEDRIQSIAVTKICTFSYIITMPYHI